MQTNNGMGHLEKLWFLRVLQVPMMSLAPSSFSIGSLISEHFDVFKEAWNEVLSADTKMSAADFEKLWDWLKWVVSTEGVTENNQTKATYFESYKNFDLDKTFVFETLKEILPEINDCLNIISLENYQNQTLTA